MFKNKLLVIFASCLIFVGVFNINLSSYPKVPKVAVASNYRIVFKATNMMTGEHKNFPVGTAVAIAPRYLLTANHVLAYGPKFPDYKLQIFDDERGAISQTIKVRCIKNDPEADLALLVVDEDLPNWVQIGYDAKVSLGDWVYVIGCKEGLNPFDVRLGNINALTDDQFPELVITSGVVRGGNSGGGAYNTSGELIGIVVRGDEMSLMVPTFVIARFLDQ